MVNPSSDPAAGAPTGPFDLAAVGAGLPVAGSLPALQEALRGHSAAVVQAPPGTGKTTLVPPALANEVLSSPQREGKVLVTAPRKVAVRAAARRLAHLDGSPLGARVGYRVRGDSRPGALVEFVTPGVLLRQLMRDPELSGVAAVALDEVHERGVDTDLLVGMLAELRQLREDLLVVAMSATVDAPRFARLLGEVPIVATDAVTHPLDISYAPAPGRVAGSADFWAHVARQAARAVAKAPPVGEAGKPGSVLVFVPGVRELHAVVDELSGVLPAGVPVLPLHGGLGAGAQDEALRPSPQGARVVVATAIAESSVTVPEVTAVVDSGVARSPRWDARRRMAGLVTHSVPVSSAEQRAGRAGREAPGLVIRCYSESELRAFPEYPAPEIRTGDLTQAALFLAVWGTPGGEGLPLLDPPAPQILAQAVAALEQIGAVDGSGHATDVGRRIAGMPADPRLARALVELGSGAARWVAALTEPDRAAGVDIAACGAAVPRRQVERLERLVDPSPPQDPGLTVALAFPQQVARKVSESPAGVEYLLAGGTRARLARGAGGGTGSAVAQSEWLAVAELTRTKDGGLIRRAAALSKAAALRAFPPTTQLVATLSDGKVRGREVTRMGAIVLKKTPAQVPPEVAAEALSRGLKVGQLPWTARARALRQRLAFVHAHRGAPWPDVSDAALEGQLGTWLAPELDELAHGGELRGLDMFAALQRLLPWPEAAHIQEYAPERLVVPSGSSYAVDYSGEQPVVACKLQECFGLAETPRLSGVPVVFHLLSPAGRPLAVTADLTSFWDGPYAGVRAEMRGRYPKHPWPEDPWNAPATGKTKRRLEAKES